MTDQPADDEPAGPEPVVDEPEVDEPANDEPAPDVPEVVRYRELARTYRSLWYSALVIAVGFGIDLALGVRGAILHLPGWALSGAVLVGIHALILYAARTTHSLTLTDVELRIGDETLPLASVAGLTSPDAVTADVVPILGWPGGRPRGMSSIVVHLEDDRDVEIPTRFPDRLRGALGLGVLAAPSGPAIRTAAAEDLALLADLDERAEIIFRVAGYDLPRIEFDTAGLDEAAVVFVAGDPAVGFAVVDLVDGSAHLAELAVVPGSMRRGLGTALVRAVCDWARDHGHARVTLITYADVPWNGPFYRQLGFAELPSDEVQPELQNRRERQTRLGLDAVGPRIVMCRVC